MMESLTLTCSICESEVDLEGEGGITGNFGICPVAFCVWCYASILDMVSQGCLRCQEDEDPTIRQKQFDYLKETTNA
tara:strand:+ start:782 stop:1012 length:231 start_codon:yes stop_codon:yes gene_type:complete